MLEFIDRLGVRVALQAYRGETLRAALERGGIPCTSVLITHDREPVADTTVYADDVKYEAALIEGYDIASIRAVRDRLFAPLADGRSAAHVERVLAFDRQGGLTVEAVPLSAAATADSVERKVVETCAEFEMVRPDGGLLVGLSGGVDSSSLLMTLAAARAKLPAFRLVAVTFEDYDAATSPTFEHAHRLCVELGVEHHVAPAALASEIFHLNTPLREVLPRLLDTKWAHFVMYIDHHTTRRTLEVFAKRQHIDRIALGLHTTDLIAGLMNAWMTGYMVGGLPVRKVGDVTYVYPLAFVSKRELHLYHGARRGSYARHTNPNPWERRPLDRNFYYYLADRMQDLWPGLESMMFLAHEARLHGQRALVYDTCRNCGASLLHQPFTTVDADECDVCSVFRQAGFLTTEGGT